MYIVDHLFVLVLFVVQPIHGAISFRRYVARVKAGQMPDRVKLYTQTILMEWIGLAILALMWRFYDRPIAELGFTAPAGVGFWIGLAVSIVLIAYLIYAWYEMGRADNETRTEQREAFGDLFHFLPQTKADFRRFVAVSITAGIVEEIVYRGFVLWYLSTFMPLWGAVIVSSMFFGIAHSYQGAMGAVRTGLVGLAFAILYVGTGSIWISIVAHALLDILQGGMILETFKTQNEAVAENLEPAAAGK
jgi:membrane protease YdiL (CAAX protease family)